MILNNDRRTTTLLVGARPVKRFNIDPGKIGEDGKRIVWTVIFQRRWKGGGWHALADLHEIPRVDFIILLYFKRVEKFCT